MDLQTAGRVIARMVALGLLSRLADPKDSGLRQKEWAETLGDVTEAEATDAARALAATADQRYGTRPGHLLEVVYAERLKHPVQRERKILRASDAQVDLAAAVAREHPPWEFADGRESGLHYVVRLAVMSGLVQPVNAVVTPDGGYSCGETGCVDCSRMPLRRERPAAAKPAEEIPF